MLDCIQDGNLLLIAFGKNSEQSIWLANSKKKLSKMHIESCFLDISVWSFCSYCFISKFTDESLQAGGISRWSIFLLNLV